MSSSFTDCTIISLIWIPLSCGSVGKCIIFEDSALSTSIGLFLFSSSCSSNMMSRALFHLLILGLYNLLMFHNIEKISYIFTSFRMKFSLIESRIWIQAVVSKNRKWETLDLIPSFHIWYGLFLCLKESCLGCIQKKI
jgi:hypothetical protein